MNIHYGFLLKKSFNDLKNNPIIFLPIVFSILFTIILFLFIGLQIFAFLKLGLNFKSNIIESIMFWSVFGIIDLLLLILVQSLIKGMQIGLLRGIISKSKTSSSLMWLGMKSFYSIIFRTTLLKFFIVIIPVVVVLLLSYIFYLVNTTAGFIVLAILGVLYLIYLIVACLFLTFGLFFIDPITSINKNNSAINLMRESFNFSKKNLSHVLLTWVIVFAIIFGFQVVMKIIMLPFFLLPIALIPVVIIFILGSIVINHWFKIFIFNSFFNYKNKK